MLFIDIRAKLLSGIIMILGIVISSSMSLLEFSMVLLTLCGIAYVLGAPLGKTLKLSMIALPFAGAVALFSPLALLTVWSWEGVVSSYASGWPMITEILSKAYLSAMVVSIITESTAIEVLFTGLSALRLPRIFLTLFTFLYRFTDIFREQIVVMRHAIASRAPGLGGIRLAALYGKLGGNLFVRAYERGEQVHDAMVSRGYTGTLPSRLCMKWGALDTYCIVVSVATALAMLFY